MTRRVIKNFELRIKNSGHAVTPRHCHVHDTGFLILNSQFLIASAVRLMLVAGISTFVAMPAHAQKYTNVGRAKCVNCHDHDREKLWSEKKDGPPPNNHLNALKQIDS